MATNPNDPWLPADPVPLSRPATPIAVYRVSAGSSPTLELMSSLRCLWIEEREGPVPATALFRYAFDGSDTNSPQSIEDALSTLSTLSKLVEVGDRLAVQATDTDGNTTWIFDGIPMTWSFTVKNDVEMVFIPAVSRFHRAWDNQVKGALIRDSDVPTMANDLATDLIAQFNPRGVANASPSTADAGTTPYKYPTFLDPNRQGTDSAGIAYPRTWTLPMAVAHLLYVNNASGTVSNPTRSTLDTLLVSREPITGTPFDPTNPASYTAKDIQVPDAPITGRPWAAVVHDLIKDCGFGMRIDLSDDSHGIPQQALTLFLKQAATPKPLYLPTRGTALNPATCNVASADMGRDLAPVVNQWTVQGALLRYEFTCILAPAFPSSSTDASGDSALMAYDLSQADPTAAVSDKYRVWILAEGGDTYYLNASTTAINNTATDMSTMLGVAAAGYVKRRRVPIGKLLSTDDNGVPLNATLQIGTTSGSAPPYPAVDLGSSITNWQEVQGGWTLLKDRVGIRITIENPEHWMIGESESGAYPDGVVRAVSAIAAPSSDNPAFFLRLTCVVEGDQALKYTATRQITSPIGYPIEREIDARDRLFKNTIAANSRFASTAAVVRDDTELAKAEAIAYRTASDSGVFQGDVEIPRFTAYYQIGDRISGINGRNLSFRTDDGGTEFAPTYPMVVARRWDFDGGQRTTLQLSDAGLDRRQYSRNKPNAKPTISSEEKARQIAILAAQIQKAGFGVSLNSNLTKHGR